MAFDTPPDVPEGGPVEHNAEFKLYKDYDAILQNPFKHRFNVVVRFGQSVKGLLPGAPVEFRGIQLGTVERIMLEENLQENLVEGMRARGSPIPVLLRLEPGRIGLPDSPKGVEYLTTALRTGIPIGMRATLQTGNLISGAKLIGLDYYEDAEPASEGEYVGYPTIPTVASGIGQLEQKLAAVLEKVNALPLEDTVADGQRPPWAT